MTESQESPKLWLWPASAIIVILIIVLLFVAVFLLGGSDDAGASVEVTPISGGAALPTELAETPNSTAVQAESEETPEPLAIGTQVISISVDGDGTRLRGDADEDILPMEILADGDSLVIIEPSGDYEGYPVWNDDAEWYGVRTSDGLVGWAKAEQLMPVE